MERNIEEEILIELKSINNKLEEISKIIAVEEEKVGPFESVLDLIKSFLKGFLGVAAVSIVILISIAGFVFLKNWLLN